jgi:hypothetical protein
LAGCVPVRQFEQQHWLIDAALINAVQQTVSLFK